MGTIQEIPGDRGLGLGGDRPDCATLKQGAIRQSPLQQIELKSGSISRRSSQSPFRGPELIPAFDAPL